MSIAEVLGIVLGLTTVGAAIVTALIRTIFVGIRIRIDRLEEKVDRCMEQMLEMARENRHG